MGISNSLLYCELTVATAKLERFFRYRFAPVYLILPLFLYGSLLTLFYDTLVILLPLPGIVAGIYGFFAKKWALSFLVGITPFIPLVFLSLPKAGIPFVLGVPNGVIGLGGALFRGKGLSRWLAFVLVLAAYSWMLVLFTLLQG